MCQQCSTILKLCVASHGVLKHNSPRRSFLSQAREDIIHMLKSEHPRPEALEAHYGSALPSKPLLALQRDSLLTTNTTALDDVYDRPMAEVSVPRKVATGHQPVSCGNTSP